MPADSDDDIEAIRTLVARQFASLNWQAGTSADWDGFTSDLYPEAPLDPLARPVKWQSVEDFVKCMKGLVGTKLRSFHETVVGTEVRVFGNVAVTIAAHEMREKR